MKSNKFTSNIIFKVFLPIVSVCVVVAVIVIVITKKNKTDKVPENTNVSDISTEATIEESVEKEQKENSTIQNHQLSEGNPIVENDIKEDKTLAMYESFISYIVDGGFPYDYPREGGYDYRQDTSSEYTLSDIDEDGRIELLIKMGSRSIAADSFYIFECNPDTGKAKLELRCYRDVDIREDGIIIGYDNHNLGITDDEWGCSIFEYDKVSDIYVEKGQSTRGEMGDYYPDKLIWHNVNDSVFDSTEYLEIIKANVKSIVQGEDDMLFDVIEKGSLYELMNTYTTKGLYDIKQEENGGMRFLSSENNDETIYCDAVEGGYLSYKNQIEGLSIAGVYPGMNIQEANDILEKIGLIHIEGTKEYYVKLYGKDAFGIYISEEMGVVSDIKLFEGSYLKWYMCYDKTGFNEFSVIGDRMEPEFLREGSNALMETEVYFIDTYAEPIDFEDISYNTNHHEVEFNISIFEVANDSIKCEVEIINTNADIVYFNMISGSLYDKNKCYLENGFWGICDSTENYTREYMSGSEGDIFKGYFVFYESVKNIDELGYITLDYIEYNPDYSDEYIMEHYEELQEKVWIKIQ